MKTTISLALLFCVITPTTNTMDRIKSNQKHYDKKQYQQKKFYEQHPDILEIAQKRKQQTIHRETVKKERSQQRAEEFHNKYNIK